MLLPEARDHADRHGRAADQGAAHRRHPELVLGAVVEQGEPHRRHARAQRHLLLVQQFVDRSAVELGAGEDKLGAADRAGIDEAPGVGVEHRHHRQDRIVRGHAEHGARAHHHRVDDGRAVRVEHALGIARRARGVAERRGGLLVEVRPLQRAGLARDQFFVAEQVRDLAVGRHVCAVGHHHDMLHRLERGEHAFDDRQQVQVDEDDLVFGMVGDVAHMLRREARIDRVQHGAEAGDAEVELEMAIGVPGQRADAVAELDAEALERFGKLLGTLLRVAIAVAVDRTFDRARDDLDVGIIACREIDHLGDQQRTVLHQAKHVVSSFRSYARRSRCRLRSDASSLRSGSSPSPGPAGRETQPSETAK